MPRKRKQFIPVEYEFIQIVSKYVSARTGITQREVIGAATQMWHECVSAGKAEIHPLVLCMYFPPETHDALIELELLSRTQDGFLVRGVVKHLEAIKAKKEGANITNAKKTEAERERGAKRTCEQSWDENGTEAERERGAKRTCEQSWDENGTEAERERGAKRTAKRTNDDERGAKRTAHVPQNTEDRIHNSEDKNIASDAEAPEASTASPHQQTINRCADAFREITGSKYLFSREKDTPAIKALLKDFTPDEIVRRWRNGLLAQGYLNTQTLAMLRSKFNELVSVPSTGPIKTSAKQEAEVWR